MGAVRITVAFLLAAVVLPSLASGPASSGKSGGNETRPSAVDPTKIRRHSTTRPMSGNQRNVRSAPTAPTPSRKASGSGKSGLAVGHPLSQAISSYLVDLLIERLQGKWLLMEWDPKQRSNPLGEPSKMTLSFDGDRMSLDSDKKRYNFKNVKIGDESSSADVQLLPESSQLGLHMKYRRDNVPSSWYLLPQTDLPSNYLATSHTGELDDKVEANVIYSKVWGQYEPKPDDVPPFVPPSKTPSPADEDRQIETKSKARPKHKRKNVTQKSSSKQSHVQDQASTEPIESYQTLPSQTSFARQQSYKESQPSPGGSQVGPPTAPRFMPRRPPPQQQTHPGYFPPNQQYSSGVYPTTTPYQHSTQPPYGDHSAYGDIDQQQADPQSNTYDRKMKAERTAKDPLNFEDSDDFLPPIFNEREQKQYGNRESRLSRSSVDQSTGHPHGPQRRESRGYRSGPRQPPSPSQYYDNLEGF